MLDRLICGSATTFHRADAVNALALVPQQRAGWFAFQATGTGSSRPMEGAAAGVGNVGIEERRRFRFATDDAVGVRAVQWKVTRELERAGRESLAIEQVKAGEMEGGAPPDHLRCVRADPDAASRTKGFVDSDWLEPGQGRLVGQDWLQHLRALEVG